MAHRTKTTHPATPSLYVLVMARHEMAHSVSSVRSTVSVLVRSAAPPPVQGLIPEFKVGESIDSKIRGAPAVKGSFPGVLSQRLHARSSRLVKVLSQKSAVPYQSKAPPSEFKIYTSSASKNQGSPISLRPYLRSSTSIRVLI